MRQIFAEEGVAADAQFWVNIFSLGYSSFGIFLFFTFISTEWFLTSFFKVLFLTLS
jgi:hypothetical protein